MAFSAPKPQRVYSYHAVAPFYMPEESLDLSRAWVAAFNNWQQEVKLELVNIERPALNAIVESEQPFLILWANPLWFQFRDPDLQASDSVFWDADVWISRNDAPVRYREPENLIGKTIGARKGFYYKGVNELVNAGKVMRVDTDSDEHSLSLLQKGKVETFVMPRSSLLYWQAYNVMPDNLHVAQAPHDAYTRHVLLSADNAKLLPLFNRFIRMLREDADWQKKLEFWGVKDLLNPFELDLDELMELESETEPVADALK
ncbi:transporter substrate-binding domain-containing protein [Aliiglaciecola sp. CAU 1673]|uniref:substrate-binding periplasmic protein n=1 Tax=Aliiglaciecola sp. CAU 1673 TaxID=3032595 RepID=UPI0023D9B4F5|nr:transporter substrate-binding domain-containing protein [Aliiglaciecola sp. CAU 1673]MDF2177343.1 transporter substrate-binding domain-containing protein [Aliiglaciecola sp. CAU 1673]